MAERAHSGAATERPVPRPNGRRIRRAPDREVDQQMIPQLLFMKNVGVVGGLLVLAAFGAGAWSLDGRGKA